MKRIRIWEVEMKQFRIRNTALVGRVEIFHIVHFGRFKIFGKETMTTNFGHSEFRIQIPE